MNWPTERPHHYINSDGFCHLGDMFEAGEPAMPMYTAEQVGHLLASTWNDGYSAAIDDHEAICEGGDLTPNPHSGEPPEVD